MQEKIHSSIITRTCESSSILNLSSEINNILNNYRLFCKVLDIKINSVPMGSSVNHYAVIILEELELDKK